MSHFSVLVIGDNVEDQLAPYHEFECTGIDNEYVVDVDETEDYRNRYNEHSRTMTESPDGKLHYPYDDEFYRDTTEDELKEVSIGGTGSFTVNGVRLQYHSKDWGDGTGYRPKVRFIPHNWVETEVPVRELISFKEYVEDDFNEGFFVSSEDELDMESTHKYGHGLLDENGEVLKVINRTNPDRKWDWYEVGGRWAGRFPIKTEFQTEYHNQTPNFSWGWSPDDRQDTLRKLTKDSALKGHIDFDLIKNDAKSHAEEQYDFVHRNVISKSNKGRTWSEVFSDDSIIDISDKRKLYNDQPIVKLFQEVAKDSKLISSWIHSIEDFYIDREVYIQNAINSAISTFAVVMDGVWYEKGEMGWFGFSDDTLSQDDWNTKVMELLNSIDDTTLLTIVDCHI